MNIKLTGGLGNTGFTHGHHQATHRIWLEANQGATVAATRHNMNYYAIAEGEAKGELVHVYEARVV